MALNCIKSVLFSSLYKPSNSHYLLLSSLCAGKQGTILPKTTPSEYKVLPSPGLDHSRKSASMGFFKGQLWGESVLIDNLPNSTNSQGSMSKIQG